LAAEAVFIEMMNMMQRIVLVKLNFLILFSDNLFEAKKLSAKPAKKSNSDESCVVRIITYKYKHLQENKE
jgi:hypothetical protein